MTDSNLVVEIHVPLTAVPGLAEDEDRFPWIEEISEFLLDLEGHGDFSIYEDGEEFGDEYIFCITDATEAELINAAGRVASLPGVPTGVYAVVTDDEAEEFGVGTRVDLY